MSNEKEELTGTVATVGYWESERIVAWAFNRLKAKLYNLIEASVVDKKQQEAIKGLIKGFSNDEYKVCIREMRYWGREAKILGEGEDGSIDISEPLENKNGIFG